MQATASFDGRQPSFASSQGAPAAMMYSQPPQGMLSAYRSYSDMSANGHPTNTMNSNHTIYTAVYSGVQVYEMEINGVAVMRRRPDSWLNATQILKVAGVDKGKRTKVLEKEILNGEHEKVQGGYGKYQGTWINYRRGREFCRAYGVEELLRPLLDYDMGGDGMSQNGQNIETPTKEQAMAANRKRLYTQSMDNRQPQHSNGTFFSNISSTASNALAAMNKVARLNSPAPRPGSSAQRRPAPTPQRQAQPVLASQESFRSGSQQSVPGLPTDRSFGHQDSAYGTQMYSGDHMEGQEPPRKKMRPTSPSIGGSQGHALDVSMRAPSPTEPSESFYQQAVPTAAPQMSTADGEVPIALPPLPHPGDKRAEDKQALLLDLFANANRVDYSNHPAILQLSGQDLDIPLDQSANTALHWAATLARVSLMRLLLSRGASIFRGNIAGETPLMAAVQVNNNLDQSCFPELLEILAPLIEVRDAKGRTILHHIAVACGIKGRAASSKYYLEALLEFLVRSNTSSMLNSSSTKMLAGTTKPIGLMRFMSEMVNARDISGNTALNLVARIGNRSIIQQLLEVQADPSMPNYKGLRPMDFGVCNDSNGLAEPTRIGGGESPTKSRLTNSKVEERSRDFLPSVTSSLTEVSSQFAAELRVTQDRIDTHNAQIRDTSALQNLLTAQVDRVQSTLRGRQTRKQQIANLRRANAEMRDRMAAKGLLQQQSGPIAVGDADAEFVVQQYPLSGPNTPSLGHGSDQPTMNGLVPQSRSPNPQLHHQHQQPLPPATVLSARVSAYNKFNARLNAHLTSLKARDTELEGRYRKVVALCTGVEEGAVERLLPQLLLAVESESDHDVGRVREFLRRVEGVS